MHFRADYNPEDDLLDQEFMLRRRWFQRKDLEVIGYDDFEHFIDDIFQVQSTFSSMRSLCSFNKLVETSESMKLHPKILLD